MMNLSQLPLFLRFNVRTLCCQLFFISIFINSQTPFSYPDSTIFISEDSYLYVESPVAFSASTSLSGKNKSIKQVSITKRKALLKLNSSAATTKNQIISSNQISFTIPESSHHIVNSNNSLSIAVLGNTSTLKQHKEMMGSALKVFLNVSLAEKKILYPFIKHFNLLKPLINHFSRPPPATSRKHKVFLTHKSHKR